MIVTSKQMKQIEQAACEQGMSMERMMENAGSAAAAAIRRTIDVNGLFVTVFCGKGNNGGDGFVVARRLAEGGANVVVVMTDGLPHTPQAQGMYEHLQLMEMAIVDYGQDLAYLTERLSVTDILVDAIYGTGFHGELDETHKDICRLLNGVGARIFSLDIPSGVNADTGAADSCSVRAHMTLVFDSLKPAIVMPRAAAYCGKAVLCDIGIPAQAHAGIESSYTVVNESHVFAQIPPRIRETHKGDYGRLLNVAGCQQYMGAAALSTLAALRTGAGYVTLASTKEVCRTVFPLVMEAVMLPLRQTPDGAVGKENLPALLDAMSQSSATLCGNGLGSGGDAEEIVLTLLENAQSPVIIDADGINIIARHIDRLKHVSCPVVLTPHIKEFSRLCGVPVEELRKDALPAALAFAAEYRVCLVLKDAHTLTVTPAGGVYINTSGNAGMARAGSGDVLAGIIGSLAAQGLEAREAAVCGVWLHGKAGDSASEIFSQAGMLPRDIISGLSHVFLERQR